MLTCGSLDEVDCYRKLNDFSLWYSEGCERSDGYRRKIYRCKKHVDCGCKLYSSVEDGGMYQVHTYGIHSEILTEKYMLNAKVMKKYESHGDMDNLLMDISKSNMTLTAKQVYNKTAYIRRNNAEEVAINNNVDLKSKISSRQLTRSQYDAANDSTWFTVEEIYEDSSSCSIEYNKPCRGFTFSNKCALKFFKERVTACKASSRPLAFSTDGTWKLLSNGWALLIVAVQVRHVVGSNIQHTVVPVMYAITFGESEVATCAMLSSLRSAS